MFVGIARWTISALVTGVAVGLIGCAQTGGTSTGTIRPFPGLKPSPPPPAPPAPPAPRPDTIVNGNLWNAAMESRRVSLERTAAGSGIEVSQTSDNQLKLLIPSDIAFAPQSVTVGPALRPTLDALANSISGLPAIQIAISAHTDNTGSDPQNNTLSLERARSVRDYLVGKGVVSPFIQAIGRGSRDPVASNDTAAGRTRNRRMEILLREPAK